jgi:hypothetical protein
LKEMDIVPENEASPILKNNFESLQ